MTLVRIKIICLWLFAILLSAANPVESGESFKEIEETEEVKFYSESRNQVKQKTKAHTSAYPQYYTPSDQELSLPVVPLNRPPRYLLYQSLNYYE